MVSNLVFLFFEIEHWHIIGGHAFVYHVFIQLIRGCIFIYNVHFKLCIRRELVLLFSFFYRGRSLWDVIIKYEYFRDIARALTAENELLAETWIAWKVTIVPLDLLSFLYLIIYFLFHLCHRYPDPSFNDRHFFLKIF